MNIKKSRNKKKSKEECEIIHFKKRMFERHGLIINKERINEICKLIQNGKSTFVKKQSNRIVIHDIMFDGKSIRIVYDKIRQIPVTVYDDSWVTDTK